MIIIKKRKFKFGQIYSISTFIILIIVIPISVIANNLFSMDFGFRGTPIFRFLFIVLVFSFAGTLASRLMSKNTVNTILEIDNATKEIANGNYNVRIEDSSRLEELSDMAENFNIMAKDLAMNDMMKNDFINNVSHEFKTPLSAIEGYAKLLSNKKLPPEKVEEYANNILFNSKRLTTMTGNILLLSTLDNSRIILNKAKFHLDEQIREMILLYQSEWDKKNIELDIDLAEFEFCGDKDLLSHVWQNLISNAVKFCNENGKITVKLNKREGKTEFQVSNTGYHVKEDEIEKIFDKFYQSDTSRASKGNGLGLSIVKKVVDLHNGEIFVTSVENGVTTFKVVIYSQTNTKPKQTSR